MTEKQHSIIIVIPYFGKLPWYFAYYLHTCRFNPTVHFLIITDDFTFDNRAPENVFIIHQSLAELIQLICEKLKLQVVIPNTYKLCDFKPAYGLIFEDYLVGYDFWGIGDIDVIYGNIRNFITCDVLANHDIITVRHDFLVGYFTLYRNCKEMNELFRQSNDYLKVFTNGQHYCFDECNFAFWKLTADNTFDDVASLCDIESMTHVVKRLQKQNAINAYFDTHAVEGIYGKLRWKGGCLTFKAEFEIMIYHLIVLKKQYSRNPPRKVPIEFRISPTRIYH